MRGGGRGRSRGSALPPGGGPRGAPAAPHGGGGLAARRRCSACTGGRQAARSQVGQTMLAPVLCRQPRGPALEQLVGGQGARGWPRSLCEPRPRSLPPPVISAGHFWARSVRSCAGGRARCCGRLRPAARTPGGPATPPPWVKCWPRASRQQRQTSTRSVRCRCCCQAAARWRHRRRRRASVRWWAAGRLTWRRRSLPGRWRRQRGAIPSCSAAEQRAGGGALPVCPAREPCLRSDPLPWLAGPATCCNATPFLRLRCRPGCAPAPHACARS